MTKMFRMLRSSQLAITLAVSFLTAMLEALTTKQPKQK